MARLKPYPFGALVTHMFRELEAKQSVFGLPASGFYHGDPRHNFSVPFHKTVAESPLGAAAGPHTQLAQNIVLSWLGGARVIELRTVQTADGVDTPRPSIDAGAVGYHLEFGHELSMELALEEYVKASMLIDMLRSGDELRTLPGFDTVLFDLGLGFELADIQGERIGAFIDAMRDTSAAVDWLRREIPSAYKQHRSLNFSTRLTASVTLTVGPGPSPTELEPILIHLLKEKRLHCFVKFSPTLLGHGDTVRLLHNELGYTDVNLPAESFTDNLRWEQAIEVMERVGETAASEGQVLGAKFSGGLPVQNQSAQLSQKQASADLTGAPLHVLAMELVRRFRKHFRDRFPISFSGGIHRASFPDAVALGLAPITVCTDLLKAGGYGRLGAYHRDLSKRMSAVRADDVDEFVISAYGLAEETLSALGLSEASRTRKNCLKTLSQGGNLRRAAGAELFDRWVEEAKLRNTEHYVKELLAGRDYARENLDRPPEKVNSELALFDCLTCDECIAVCPNRAAFSVSVPEPEIPSETVVRSDWGWEWVRERGRPFKANHQIAVFADLCNACGNCNVFCPEQGGPHLKKPFLFNSLADFNHDPGRDGFFLDLQRVHARIEGMEYHIDLDQGWVNYTGDGFRFRFNELKPQDTLTGEATVDVDMTPYHIMRILQMGVLQPSAVNFLTSRIAERASTDTVVPEADE